MLNPNVYDDEAYSKESMDLDSSLVGMWDAGASIENIEETIVTAFENCDPSVKVEVTITERSE